MEQHRADVARARRRWIREQRLLDPVRLVFIDETAVTPLGVRLIGHVPHGHWKIITFVAALRHDKIVAPMVVDGPMTGEMFLMDNLGAHKVLGVREAIEKARATPRYLPQYSPDLNPIEMPFSKFKAFLRKVAERTVPGHHRANWSFLPCLSDRESTNYFRHAGYGAM